MYGAQNQYKVQISSFGGLKGKHLAAKKHIKTISTVYGLQKSDNFTVHVLGCYRLQIMGLFWR